MADVRLTPTTISGWLCCEHSLSLMVRRSAGELFTMQSPGSFSDLLRAKGETHERDRLAAYLSDGKKVETIDPQQRDSGETFEHWVERIGNPLEATDADVLYQVPFISRGIRGIADFIERVEHPDPGAAKWEAVDAKLARREGKPGHVLQLCFYTECIESLTGTPPRAMHLELGSKSRESFLTEHFAAYWRRISSDLIDQITSSGDPLATLPEPCDHCNFCDFQPHCTSYWRETDSLTLVADITKKDRATLKESSVTTVEALAEVSGAVEGMEDYRLNKLTVQAQLQKEFSSQPDGSTPPFREIPPGADGVWGHGYSLLPLASDGDLFFDIEGHPFWTAEQGLVFLFGLLEKGSVGWAYRTPVIWAHNPDQELVAAIELLKHLEDRRTSHPEMHVYHYNHTERTVLLQILAGTAYEDRLLNLIETGLFIDLLAVLKNAFQVGTESYGLKFTERLASFERHAEIAGGSGAVVDYERYMGNGDPALLEGIERYNEDDVRATMALRDWLIDPAQRDSPVEWREAFIELEDAEEPDDELIGRLLDFAVGSTERLLGNMLGYWRREFHAYLADRGVALSATTDAQRLDDTCLTGLSLISIDEEEGGEYKRATFSWPDQAHEGFGSPNRYHYLAGGELQGSSSFATNCDVDSKTITLSLPAELSPAEFPNSVACGFWVGSQGLYDSLELLARSLLGDDDARPNPVSLQLLARDTSKFVADGGPPGGQFSDDIDQIVGWVGDLDHSYLMIQGPPGTGKTYTGARIALELARADRSVAVVSQAHKTVAHFFDEVIDVAAHIPGRGVKMCRLQSMARDAEAIPKEIADDHHYVTTGSSTMTRSKNKVKFLRFDISGGAIRFPSNKDFRQVGFDYLIVEEAGQLSLPDVVAASCSAKNVILLGDPQQLPQVSQASHPDGSGESVLGHLLAGEPVVPKNRGVFIATSRRMHPEICEFISNLFYDGDLDSLSGCELQEVTSFGAGLRWLEVDHQGCTQSADAEAHRIKEQILEILSSGAQWIDRKGVTNDFDPAHSFMVVAPFNAQKDLIREVLESDPRTAPVAENVGTVDKFQGREAPVVFYSMTASSGEDAPRGAGFLFSRARLNVAVSRAQCLSYVVCTRELLRTRGRSVEEMRLVSTLNSYVEYATS
jgi:predicted RecB family nuclease